ncbi:serine/arginine repetitive matrix protein 2 isoform X1 [Hyalella azteca]|uniref:Serine/arginine repetitive matrix protein 2 isoform X1 n=1 Tax=Hyalella azteca TaxID=294128 RepID=A0A8B7N8I5_HYAAZ|nr:serine/arginine repetitive matrix protein 2 isoform X1 [Hyalella azteca]
MSKSAVAINVQIGHTAHVLTQSTEEGYTHEWSVWVQGENNRSITEFVEKVVFTLHESFKRPKRIFKTPPFKVIEKGYGGFNLPVEIYFKSNNEETRKTRFEYDLFLQEISGEPINHIRTERLTFFSPQDEFRKKLLSAGGEIVTNEEGLTSPPVPSASLHSTSNNHTSSAGGGSSRGIRSSTTSSISADSAKHGANSAKLPPHKTSVGKKTKNETSSSANTAVKKVGVEASEVFMVVQEIQAVTDFNEVFKGGTWLEASAKLFLWAEDKEPSESNWREALQQLAEKHRYGTVSRYIASVAPLRIEEFSYEAILQTDHVTLKAIANAKKILHNIRQFFGSLSDSRNLERKENAVCLTSCYNNEVDLSKDRDSPYAHESDLRTLGSPKVVLRKLQLASLESSDPVMTGDRADYDTSVNMTPLKSGESVMCLASIASDAVISTNATETINSPLSAKEMMSSVTTKRKASSSRVTITSDCKSASEQSRVHTQRNHTRKHSHLSTAILDTSCDANNNIKTTDNVVLSDESKPNYTSLSCLAKSPKKRSISLSGNAMPDKVISRGRRSEGCSDGTITTPDPLYWSNLSESSNVTKKFSLDKSAKCETGTNSSQNVNHRDESSECRYKGKAGVTKATSSKNKKEKCHKYLGASGRGCKSQSGKKFSQSVFKKNAFAAMKKDQTAASTTGSKESVNEGTSTIALHKTKPKSRSSSSSKISNRGSDAGDLSTNVKSSTQIPKQVLLDGASEDSNVTTEEMKKPDNFVDLFGEPLKPYKDKTVTAAKSKTPVVKTINAAKTSLDVSKTSLNASKTSFAPVKNKEDPATSSSRSKSDVSKDRSSKSRDKEARTEHKHDEKKSKSDKDRDKERSKSSKDDDKKSGDKEKSSKSDRHSNSDRKDEKGSHKDSKKSSKSDKDKKESKDKYRDKSTTDVDSKKAEEKEKHSEKSSSSRSKESSSKKSSSGDTSASKKETATKVSSKSEQNSSKSHKDHSKDKHKSKTSESSHKESSQKEKSDRNSPKSPRKESSSHSKNKSDSNKPESSKHANNSKGSKSGGDCHHSKGSSPVIVTESPPSSKSSSHRHHHSSKSPAPNKAVSLSPSKDGRSSRASSSKHLLSPAKLAVNRSSSSSPAQQPSRSGAAAHDLSPSPSSTPSSACLPPPAPLPKVSPAPINSPRNNVATQKAVAPSSHSLKKELSPDSASPTDVSQLSRKSKKRPRSSKDSSKEVAVPPPINVNVAQKASGEIQRQSRSCSSSSFNSSKSPSPSRSDSGSSKSRSRSRSSSSAKSQSSRSASPSSGNPSRSRSGSASPSRSRTPSGSGDDRSRSVSSSSSTSPSPPRANNSIISPGAAHKTLGILLDQVSSTSDSEDLELPSAKRAKIEPKKESKKRRAKTAPSPVVDVRSLAKNPAHVKKETPKNTGVNKKFSTMPPNSTKDSSRQKLPTPAAAESLAKLPSHIHSSLPESKGSDDEEDDDSAELEASDDSDGDDFEMARRNMDVKKNGSVSDNDNMSDTGLSEDEIGDVLSDAEEQRIFEEGKAYVMCSRNENGEAVNTEYPDWYFNESRVYYLRKCQPPVKRLQLDALIGSLRAREFGAAGMEVLGRVYDCLLDNNVPLASSAQGLMVNWKLVPPCVLKKVLKIFTEFTDIEE